MVRLRAPERPSGRRSASVRNTMPSAVGSVITRSSARAARSASARVALVHEQHVDVARVVQLGAAELAHADHGHRHARRGDRRARLRGTPAPSAASSAPTARRSAIPRRSRPAMRTTWRCFHRRNAAAGSTLRPAARPASAHESCRRSRGVQRRRAQHRRARLRSRSSTASSECDATITATIASRSSESPASSSARCGCASTSRDERGPTDGGIGRPLQRPAHGRAVDRRHRSSVARTPDAPVAHTGVWLRDASLSWADVPPARRSRPDQRRRRRPRRQRRADHRRVRGRGRRRLRPRRVPRADGHGLPARGPPAEAGVRRRRGGDRVASSRPAPASARP